MKKVILFFCVGLILLCSTACNLLDDSMNKSDIFKLVTENEQLILDDIKSGNFENMKKIKGIKEIDPDEEIIDFYCGGAGFGSATYYCGFYYTDNDNITAIWCSPKSEDELKPYGNGFLYEETDGDNRYYTEKICENFYFYEASF